MAELSFTSAADEEVLARIQSGELEAAGILVREATGNRRITHVLRGAEGLPTAADGNPDLSVLAPLQAVIGTQKVIGLVGIAQNAATAATIRRIEEQLQTMLARLAGMDARLGHLQRDMTLVVEALRSAPVGRLRAATTSASVAHRLSDRSALIMAAGQADRAARELLDMAGSLVSVEQETVPAAFLAPADLAALVQSASDAAKIASAIYLALAQRDEAARMMHGTAASIGQMRARLARALMDRNVSIQRVHLGTVPDEEIRAAAATLRDCQQATLGRALLIELGVISPGQPGEGFEVAKTAADPGFVEVPPATTSGSTPGARPHHP